MTDPTRTLSVSSARSSRMRNWLLIVGGAVLLITIGAAPWLAPHDPLVNVDKALLAPSSAHSFGTDDLGRDVLSGVFFGIRTSVFVGFTVAAFSLVFGGTVGLVAGYYGARIDDWLMRFTELIQILPRFFLALLVVALFGPSLTNVIVVLALTSWSMTARVMRSRVLVVKEADFVTADRSTGARDRRLMFRTIGPNVLAPVVALVTLQFGSAILVEAGLSFLGLGDPNSISLGLMLSRAQPFLRVAWWMALFPGVALAVTVLFVNLLADVINDGSDPRAEERS